MRTLLIVGIALTMAACATSGGPGNNHPAKHQVRVDMRTCHMDDAERDTKICWQEAQVKWPVSHMEIKKGNKEWRRMAQRAVVIDCLEQKGYRVQPKGEPNWF